ncbi:MAG: hypothetical protein JO142_19335 [Burkholderiales bacterium]|nr:hypothetical protein [Burkholderiales bacterium]
MRFRQLFQVNFEHTYFENGRARDWYVTPDAGTQQFMRRFGLVLRCDGREMGVYGEEAKLPGVWSERESDAGRAMRFDVRSRDAYCAYYTDCAKPAPEVEYGVPVAGKVLEPRVRTAGHPDASVVATVSIGVGPIGPADLDGWLATLGQVYELRFDARATVWKYLLVGAWTDEALYLIDARGGIQFSDAEEEVLPDGRRVTTFRSRSAIRLQEQPVQRIQLRCGDPAAERILIARLPAASPRGLRLEVRDGVMTSVSEIFVNR